MGRDSGTGSCDTKSPVRARVSARATVLRVCLRVDADPVARQLVELAIELALALYAHLHVEARLIAAPTVIRVKVCVDAVARAFGLVAFARPTGRLFFRAVARFCRLRRFVARPVCTVVRGRFRGV